jgi:O-6-methylguanine DNA methyltransferase
MTETNLQSYRTATERAVAPEFTAQVFARIGLDRYITAASPLGPAYVAWTATGVSALRLAGDAAAFEAWYEERFGRRVVPALEDDATAAAARAKLGGADIAVPLDLRECSPFEQRVLERAAAISAGYARPYALLAREMGMPQAARAVGSALGRNPVPLLIACHRVVRGDNTVGGYIFGSDAKRALLAREGVDMDAAERIVRRGFRYIACGDGTFCLPTCGDIATRVEEPEHYLLRDLDDAHAHGLVPCEGCRPVAA